ncbi:TonB-dependent receptor plug domain-containing protein [Pseudodesulfovibrio sediminis]|uniref:TonB-dependent receptor n=1 Tax=Pseudodesulfovibrio sediminis TaxID=2810563 RepID=A0ABN6EQG0_9BACT|nr:TonB-dependent receptor plug domain-containing protein [Pseudodesulfovibrio sediminis]BCS87645.1 TonB-dependent receptor [Pseudodesulfovibrio sediminis]
MEVEVVTANRRAEPMSQVAGAVTVLTEEDIMRSGATTIPEVLKLVPGVHVEQVDTDKWVVGIRGFSGLLSNKHLVLLDGRPITSPSTASVVWGNTTPVSMIKRIEVVKGAWAHLWGADSFTGVINIITKSASEMQGGESVTTAGTTGVEQLLRYGGSVSDFGNYSAYVGGSYKTDNWNGSNSDPRSSRDWVNEQTGLRLDWMNAYTDSFSLQGAYSSSVIEDGARGSLHIYDPHTRHDYGGYGQLVWNRATGLDAGITFRTSFSRDLVSVDDLSGGTNTADVEVQYAVEQMGRHRFTWGVGARYFWDDIRSGTGTSMDQSRRYSFTMNGFGQDRVTLIEDNLFLVLGMKLDSFGEYPVEVQPTVRLLHVREDDEMWVAVSRAVRVENRWQRGGSYSIDRGGVIYTITTPDHLTPEKLIAYEAGYRRRFTPDLDLDLSLFVNDYSQLAMLDFDTATNTATLTNSLQGKAYGFETQFNWRANSWLELRPSIYGVYQQIDGDEEYLVGDSMPEKGVELEYKLMAMTKPLDDVGFDVCAGYVDSPTNNKRPGYWTLEAHTSWQASNTLLLELIGRNLLVDTVDRSELRIGPSLDFRVTWDF